MDKKHYLLFVGMFVGVCVCVSVCAAERGSNVPNPEIVITFYQGSHNTKSTITVLVLMPCDRLKPSRKVNNDKNGS